MKPVVSRLVSVRVGLIARYPRPKWDKTSGTTWASAYIKSPVTGAVAVGALGLAGDQQYDRRHHGGEQMAVLAYADSHYEAWRDELDIHEMGPGGFGENLTVSGIDETSVCIGDTWAVGDVRLQVSQPRGPCMNIARRWDRADLLEKVAASGRSGWYLRVLTPGTIAVNQPFKLLERLHPDFTVAKVLALRMGHEKSADLAARLTECAELSPVWREKFAVAAE
ncbi:MAG: MOSC domain-containing protein [Candidatus Eisenbacteria bacterium]|uniref:MOSC domain-containing protein n=1 Tax=Eiseniibacteriota bacterium TaxID=2212470 RepID=A0A849SMN9_UNCEI|nr:MOSC domain-containing protein [Candidatus Eisenbacteria bacterium]